MSCLTTEWRAMSLLLIPCLLSFPSVALAAIQVFLFPSRPSSSNISSVLYSANAGINQRSNSSDDGLRKLLPQELTFCSSHQQELLDGSPPYQVHISQLVKTNSQTEKCANENIVKPLVSVNLSWPI